MSNANAALAVAEAAAGSGALGSATDVPVAAIDNAGDVAVAIVEQVGETVRNENDNSAARDSGPVDDNTVETLINAVRDVLETYLEEKGKTDREKIKAGENDKPTDEEVDEAIQFEPQSGGGPENDGLFANFGDETKGTDGKPIFGGRPSIIVPTMPDVPDDETSTSDPDAPLPSAIVALSSVGLLPGEHKLQSGAQLVRRGSFKLNLRQIGQSAPGSLSLLVGLVELNPERIDGFDTFASIQVTSEMGRASAKWTASASTRGDTTADPLAFGKADVSASSIAIRGYAGIDLPIDMGGEDQAAMSVDIQITVGIE